MYKKGLYLFNTVVMPAAFWLTFYPPGEPHDSCHPSMILPKHFSVCYKDSESKFPLHAPYINYNRCLPKSWNQEMELRLTSNINRSPKAIEQMSALINCLIYNKEFLKELSREGEFWQVLDKLNERLENNEIGKMSAGEERLMEQFVRLAGKIERTLINDQLIRAWPER